MKFLNRYSNKCILQSVYFRLATKSVVMKSSLQVAYRNNSVSQSAVDRRSVVDNLSLTFVMEIPKACRNNHYGRLFC